MYGIPMKNDHLIWHEESRREVYRSRVLSVRDTTCRSPAGTSGVFTIIDASDWAIVVPVIETERGKEFVMVRQWRHGSRELSLEFPGGVFEPGEDPLEAAARELREETAYAPNTIRKIGEFSPNPAIMANHVHIFLAEDLRPLDKQDLDDDEYVDVELVPVREVFLGLGRPPYVHALMGSAYCLYLQAAEATG
ncbi:DNA mismatch repair protein MutT [Spirochaetia bacterium]|nr:DNA mismatch repair protein MutT [Spirochaetia bacterium]GHV76273.1 DNA mismatch repair protein MutT [Spirochaetia bacterium]